MLAFNVQGERFQPPASTMFWRVRRLKPGGRGTPEVMFGPDGAPLMLPLETELADFRAAVKNAPGRYRLDPVDDQHKSCEGGSPSYLQISKEAEEPVTVTPAPVTATGPQTELIEMLVRANTDMVRSISERFASVMDSAAILIRAADGAGLPAREPAAVPAELWPALRNAAALGEEGDDDGDGPEPGEPTLAAVLNNMTRLVMPMVNHAMNTKVLGLTPEQSIAMLGGTPPPVAAVTGTGNVTASQEGAGALSGDEASDEAVSPAAFMSHVAAIEAKLTPAEAGLARQAITQMPPEALAAWRTRLMAMTVDEAVAQIRAEVQRKPKDGEKKEKAA